MISSSLPFRSQLVVNQSNFQSCKSTRRKFLLYLEGTLSSRISPWQRAGHFENCNAHFAGISHLSLTPDPIPITQSEKKNYFIFCKCFISGNALRVSHPCHKGLWTSPWVGAYFGNATPSKGSTLCTINITEFYRFKKGMINLQNEENPKSIW
jgi:hypothetical protein